MAIQILTEGYVFVTDDGVAAPLPMARRTAAMIAPERVGQAAQDQVLLQKLTPTAQKIEENITAFTQDLQSGHIAIGQLAVMHGLTMAARRTHPGFMLRVMPGDTPQEMEAQLRGILSPDDIERYVSFEADNRDGFLEKAAAYTNDMVRNYLGLSMSNQALPAIENPLSADSVAEYLRDRLMPQAGRPLDGEVLKQAFTRYVDEHHGGSVDAAKQASVELERWTRDGVGSIPPHLKKGAEKMCATFIATHGDSIDPIMMGSQFRVQPYIRDYQEALGFRAQQFPAMASALDPTVYISKTTPEQTGASKPAVFREESLHLMQFHSPYQHSRLSVETIMRAFHSMEMAHIVAAAAQVEGRPHLSEDQKLLVDIAKTALNLSSMTHPLDIQNEGESKILDVRSAVGKMSKDAQHQIQNSSTISHLAELAEQIISKTKTAGTTMPQAVCHPLKLDQISMYGGRRL